VPSVDSSSGDHRAACHFAESVAAGEHGALFSDASVAAP